MESVRSWALTVCLCSIGSALIYFLVPKGNLEKPMRTVISIFLLAVIISPLMKSEGLSLESFNFDAGDFSSEIEENAAAVNGAVIESFAKLVGQSVDECLDGNGYEGYETEVKAASDEQGRIRVESITLYFENVEGIDQDALGELVYKETGLYPEVAGNN